IDLAGTLRRLKYAEVRGHVTAPGQFRREGDAWELYPRGVEDDHERRPARVRLELEGARIAHVMRDGQALGGIVLEPEILTSAAARAYFRKEVHQLALTEAALIAGMARAPNSYSPAANPERARQRRDAVLGRMRELGWISAADFEAGRRQPIRVRPVPVPGQW